MGTLVNGCYAFLEQILLTKWSHIWDNGSYRGHWIGDYGPKNYLNASETSLRHSRLAWAYVRIYTCSWCFSDSWLLQTVSLWFAFATSHPTTYLSHPLAIATSLNIFHTWKIYLKMKFSPLSVNDTMDGRWTDVCIISSQESFKTVSHTK